MLKQYKGRLQGRGVEIRKLSAARALQVHGRVAHFLSGSIGEIMEGMGKSETDQLAFFGKAIQKAFGSISDVDAMTSFIEEILTDGNVAVDNVRVSHLDDLERFDDVDGSLLMYELLAQWCVLNLGDLVGKLGSGLGGLVEKAAPLLPK